LRIYSHKAHMWVMLRNVTWNVVTCALPRGIGIGHMCVTQCSGVSWLGYYKHQTASPTANVNTCHVHLICTRM